MGVLLGIGFIVAFAIVWTLFKLLVSSAIDELDSGVRHLWNKSRNKEAGGSSFIRSASEEPQGDASNES